jgi:diguanylate cyclase (GGDEF)-like protein
VTYARLKTQENGPYFIAGIPTLAVYGPVFQQSAVYGLAALLTGLVVVFIAWRFGRNFIIQPLADLADAARRITHGELSARAHPRRAFREAGELAHAFNAMVSSIEDQMRRIARLNRVYEVLSSINGALLRIRDREELIGEAIRIAAEKGRFKLVVIAQSGAGAAPPVLLGQRGASEAEIGALHRLLADNSSQLAQSLRQALARAEPLVVNDVQERTRDALGALLAGMGLGSVGFFPFEAADQSGVVLSLGVPDAGFFDQAEVKLLRELAADIGLGLRYIDQSSRLDFLKHFDPVTRLPNRDSLERHLEESLSRAAHRGRYLAVLTLDVNDYRRIVDAMGKRLGDAIMERMAMYLSSCLRDGDMVAILGRDTFGVVLCDLRDENDGSDVLEKIIGGLPSRIGSGSEEVFFTMRVGAAMFPRDGATAQVLLSNADLAMQSVRGQAGTSFAFHSKGADVEAHERIQIEAALRSAVANGELSVVYQPVVRIPTREVVAVEALMRWHSATLGSVPPSRFIPIAEHRNLIVPMGDWLMRTVAGCCTAWRERGLPALKWAVNASMHQLMDPKFPDRVASILEEAGLDRSERLLSIEITESQLMSAPDKVLPVLERLRAAGLSLAIDDFGTGYSSLAYLTRLPVNTLKIDQSFVAAIGTRSGLAVATAIVNLAHSLHLWVVAEGVETDEQLERLRTLDCDAAQGYLFAKPLPASELEAFVAANARSVV